MKLRVHVWLWKEELEYVDFLWEDRKQVWNKEYYVEGKEYKKGRKTGTFSFFEFCKHIKEQGLGYKQVAISNDEPSSSRFLNGVKSKGLVGWTAGRAIMNKYWF